MSDLVQNIAYSHLKISEDNPGMWQDFILQGRPFGNLCMYSNDFVSWVPDEWTITEVNAATQLIGDERNGVLSITPAGADNDGAQLQLGGTGDGETTGESWAPAAGKNLWFETRVRATTDVTQSDFFVGLHVEDTTIIAGRGADYIGFRSDDADALIDVESCNTSVASSETNIATGVDNTWMKLGFKVTGVDKVEYYYNDVLKATITTNIPTALMKLSLAYLSGEAVANVFAIDYVVIAQTR